MRKNADLTGDSFFLAKLNLGDMVTLEAKYHTKCLLALYNRTRKVQTAQQQTSSKDDEISGIFAKLLMCVEQVCSEASIVPVFKLTDMAQLYISRVQQFEVMRDKKIHTRQRHIFHICKLKLTGKILRLKILVQHSQSL